MKTELLTLLHVVPTYSKNLYEITLVSAERISETEILVMKSDLHEVATRRSSSGFSGIYLLNFFFAEDNFGESTPSSSGRFGALSHFYQRISNHIQWTQYTFIPKL